VVQKIYYFAEVSKFEQDRFDIVSESSSPKMQRLILLFFEKYQFEKS